uniref:VPS9 domain-containing protein n=1 Tax=Mucochytrium quahogii TaxID=96639 RepID=A0A7S2SN57_9STRA|mmetsp:Transcript_4367/g.6491  ORF Transcript_4367/g.6491 Transcript_4367/m.6491 type:complete len:508 (+) Transcript_4367:140-1663(+)|eukprot:CAMPEP_0203761832 /NCGR_PEP_ID=MMETSP0098-20131031/14843_1 /ASSEMBLY_ACC=CAM_ASM_000208 /TAXON_ID=96639 /ORGANISM=" , Strain NY0313808BC1" /LENGTH=507 /DNA_ID=CAMNT_0050655987 /DNA_START=108 /DNA_END=1631 /DNA_ORIENTATION=-
MEELDLESDLFDELYEDGGSAQAGNVDHLVSAKPLRVVAASQPWATHNAPDPPKQPRRSHTNQRAMSSEERLRHLRRISDNKVSVQFGKLKFEVLARTDQTIASVFAKAILKFRETGEEVQAPPRKDQRSMASGRLESIEKMVLEQLSQRGVDNVSNGHIESVVSENLDGLRIDKLETLLYVYGLHNTDTYGKLEIIRHEFNEYLKTSVDEVQLHAYFALVLCGAEHPIQEKLSVMKHVCPVIPHLYLLDEDPTARFQIGRAAAVYVRLLVMLYHPQVHIPDHITTALNDLKRVVLILTKVLLYKYPLLATATLPLENKAALHEKTSLVCRCAVEEMVAVPLYQGVLRPLYLMSDFAQTDREILQSCDKLVGLRKPHAILEELQCQEKFILRQSHLPYEYAIKVLKLVWDPDSQLGAGPTAKARILVKASQLIPQAVPNGGGAGLGADDLMPIFVYLTVMSRPPNLASMMNYLEACVSDELMSSQAGYSLALLQTALQIIPTLKGTG